jgi:hypothetical protein
MATNDRIRLEIAFEGQQVLTVYVTAAIADELDQALAAQTDASMTFDAEDGRYTVAVRKVIFVKRFARESRVGFGTAS